MSVLSQLQARRKEVVTRMRQLAESEMDDTQQTEFDTLKAENEKLETRAASIQAVNEAERSMAGTNLTGGTDTQFDDLCRQVSLTKAIAAGIPDLAGSVDTSREREVSRELERRGMAPRHGGFMVPLSIFARPIERRVLTTTTPPAGPGGNLIATDHLGNQFIDILRAKLVIGRLGARVLNDLHGNVEIPRLNGSVVAQWIAENAPLTVTEPLLGKLEMKPKHVGALAEYSRNMILQSSPDIESLLRDDMAHVLAEAIDKVAISGGGANQPNGVLSTIGINTFSLASIGWPDLLEAISDVEVANTSGTAWVGRPETAVALMSELKVADDASAGFIMSDPRTLAGYPFASSTLVPNNLGVGTSKKALLFGDFSQVMVGYWGALEILVNPYISPSYEKGNIMIRALFTCDVAIRHAKSFSAAVDLA